MVVRRCGRADCLGVSKRKDKKDKHILLIFPPSRHLIKCRSTSKRSVGSGYLQSQRLGEAFLIQMGDAEFPLREMANRLMRLNGVFVFTRVCIPAETGHRFRGKQDSDFGRNLSTPDC